MDEQCSPLSWAYCFQEEGVDELKQSILYSTLELEAAVIAAHEEISRKDEEILLLKGLLARITGERDEFQTKCQQHVLEKQLLLRQVQIQAKQQLENCPISSGTTSYEDDNNALSSSDCDENIVVSKDTLPLTPSAAAVTDGVPIKKALPEQGKFLQAVMEAGPLLQTLLLAGPLPQWQHPPPQLNSVDIPPVTMTPSPRPKMLRQDSCIISPTTSGGITNKRGLVNKELASEFSPSSKYQKVCSPVIIDSNIVN